MYAFRLRGTDEFERIYSLFGTAPLCRADQSVPLLASMIQETGSMRQLFVLPAMDEATLTALCCLPGIADIGGADGVEALLYEPDRTLPLPRRTHALPGKLPPTARRRRAYHWLSAGQCRSKMQPMPSGDAGKEAMPMPDMKAKQRKQA